MLHKQASKLSSEQSKAQQQQQQQSIMVVVMQMNAHAGSNKALCRSQRGALRHNEAGAGGAHHVLMGHATGQHNHVLEANGQRVWQVAGLAGQGWQLLLRTLCPVPRRQVAGAAARDRQVGKGPAAGDPVLGYHAAVHPSSQGA